MIRVLITGMSGTGKSTLIGELAKRGHRVLDADNPDLAISEPRENGEWGWRVDRVRELLFADTGSDLLFLSGCSEEQVALYSHFDHIVLLSAPSDVIADRLATRATNSYGKDRAELARVMGYIETVEPLLRASADLEIVTTKPPEAVADEVLEHVWISGPRSARKSARSSESDG